LTAAADPVEAIVCRRARTPPPGPAAAEAQAHANALRGRHGPGVAAILMYGSTLRDGQVDGRILDFYVLVDRIGPAYAKALPRALGALDQPNVHFLPAGEGRAAAAKYALMTLPQFVRRCGPEGFSSYIWGRFAQPNALVWARDEDAEAQVIAALARAARTMLGSAAPLLPAGAAPEDIWTRAFSESYRAEPRSEPPGQAAALYRANADYYDAIANAVGETRGTAEGAQRAWARRRVFGKGLAVARIVKSALTFEGGVDYAIWKIGRHSGAPVSTEGKSRAQKLAILWRLVRTRAIR